MSLGLVGAVLASAVLVSTSGADVALADGGRTAAEVADEIVAVQERADEVAAEWVQRDADAADLRGEMSQAEQAVARAVVATQAIEGILAQAAIDRFTGVVAPSFLLFSDEVMAGVQRNVLAKVAANSGNEDLDSYRDAQADLKRRQEELLGLQADGHSMT